MWQWYTKVIAKLSLYPWKWHMHRIRHSPPLALWGQAMHLFEDGVITTLDNTMGVTVLQKWQMPRSVGIVLPNGVDTQPCGEVFHDV